MRVHWKRCLLVGLLIMAVDLITALVVGREPADSQIATLMSTLDNFVNIMLFGWVGFRTGVETGHATAAAEAGVVASLLPAAAAATLFFTAPQIARVSLDQPLLQQVVAIIAFNIALGGITAWLAGLVSRRGHLTQT